MGFDKFHHSSDDEEEALHVLGKTWLNSKHSSESISKSEQASVEDEAEESEVEQTC